MATEAAEMTVVATEAEVVAEMATEAAKVAAEAAEVAVVVARLRSHFLFLPSSVEKERESRETKSRRYV